MSPLICYSSCYVIPCSLQLGKKILVLLYAEFSWAKLSLWIMVYFLLFLFFTPTYQNKSLDYFSCMLLLDFWETFMLYFLGKKQYSIEYVYMHVYCLVLSKASPEYVYKCRMACISLKNWAWIVLFFLIESTSVKFGDTWFRIQSVGAPSTNFSTWIACPLSKGARSLSVLWSTVQKKGWS